MKNNNSIASNLVAVWASYRRMPTWVQLWVGLILFPANAASLGMLDTWFGTYAAWAAGFVFLTNMPILYGYRGMTRLMAIPHLIAWIPLELLGLMRLAGKIGPLRAQAGEMQFVLLIVVVNGISLVFDVIDSKRWIQGERDVA